MAVKVLASSFEVKTKRENQVIDLTPDVREAFAASGFSKGIATVFVTGSTAAITVMEFEPGLIEDFPEMLRRAVPKEGIEYAHHRKWHDANGHSHVKASLVGPSVTVPFMDGDLALGEWQQIVLVEFDIRPRTRRVIVQLVGE